MRALKDIAAMNEYLPRDHLLYLATLEPVLLHMLRKRNFRHLTRVRKVYQEQI